MGRVLFLLRSDVVAISVVSFLVERGVWVPVDWQSQSQEKRHSICVMRGEVNYNARLSPVHRRRRVNPLIKGHSRMARD